MLFLSSWITHEFWEGSIFQYGASLYFSINYVNHASEQLERKGFILFNMEGLTKNDCRNTYFIFKSRAETHLYVREQHQQRNDMGDNNWYKHTIIHQKNKTY